MRANWAWAALIAVVTLVLSFLVLNGEVLEVGDQLASVISCLIALATLVITLVVRREPAPDPEERLRSATTELARRVSRQWSREAANRGLLHGDPLRVRWQSTTRAVQPAPAEIAGPGVTRLKLHGDVLGIAGAFRQLPPRRLVVIGAPGAGKSSLAALLVTGLLDDPVAGEPVPVLVNVSGWNPAEHLDAWLSRQLAEQHPFLGRETATRLVERELVMPVLDGLDEMPEGLRPAALAALADATGARRPFVLTCRAREYEELMTRTGVPLARAAVVEIEPVGPAEVAGYLPVGQIDGARRWRPVIDELTARPSGELARALVTPLMVYLARIVYSAPANDPAELLTFASATEVERHLLGAYLPAVYRRRPLPPSASGARRQRDRSAEDARSWLAFLARRLQARGSSELAWWELPEGRSRPPTRIRATPRAAVTGVVAGLAVGVAADLWRSIGVPMIAGLAVSGGLFSSVGSPSRDLDMVTPPESLRRDRACLVLIMLCAAVPMIAFIAAVAADVSRDGSGSQIVRFAVVLLFVVIAPGVLVLLILFGALSAIVRAPGGAWSRFWAWRAGQAARRHLPLRLMAFLEDAHRRGVLRQVGAVYQFRHARLQEYLAGE